MGFVVTDPEDFTVEKGTFEIVPWPVQGWRPLDPGTGDEAGTTEGGFDIFWSGDVLRGKNHTIATTANQYVLGYAKAPEECSEEKRTVEDPDHMLTWYSDYHPDGGQMFKSTDGKPFVTCLAPRTKGDDVKPTDYTAFYVEGGKGVYIHPGTWHNAVFIHPSHSPATFFNRQGKVHARVSVNWAKEFNTLLRIPLKPSAIVQQPDAAAEVAPVETLVDLKTTVIGAYPKPAYLKIPDFFNTGGDQKAGLLGASLKAYSEMLSSQTEESKASLEKDVLRATTEVIGKQCQCGVDIVTDGEVRRENYIHYLCRFIEGIDFAQPKEMSVRNNAYTAVVPTVNAEVKWRGGLSCAEEWKKAQACAPEGVSVKYTLPGPMTIVGSVFDAHYKDDARLAGDLAKILNQQVRELAAAGCKYIQVDEPVFARKPEECLAYGIRCLEECFAGVGPAQVERTMHMCCVYPGHVGQTDFLMAETSAYRKIAPALDVSCLDAVSIEDAWCRNDLSLLGLFKQTKVILGTMNVSSSRVEGA